MIKDGDLVEVIKKPNCLQCNICLTIARIGIWKDNYYNYLKKTPHHTTGCHLIKIKHLRKIKPSKKLVASLL